MIHQVNKIFSFLPVDALLLLGACASGNQQSGTPDSVAEADTLKLIETEILRADSFRLDSMRKDSVSKVEKKDSLETTTK